MLYRIIFNRATTLVPVLLAVTLAGVGVTVALAGNPLSGSTILGGVLVGLGALVLAEASHARTVAHLRRQHERDIESAVRAVSAAEVEVRRARLSMARASTRRLRAAADEDRHRALTNASAAALVAYAQGAPADEAMRAFRTA